MLKIGDIFWRLNRAWTVDEVVGDVVLTIERNAYTKDKIIRHPLAECRQLWNRRVRDLQCGDQIAYGGHTLAVVMSQGEGRVMAYGNGEWLSIPADWNVLAFKPVNQFIDKVTECRYCKGRLSLDGEYLDLHSHDVLKINEAFINAIRRVT